MSYVLVINSGSSSFKYQLLDMATERSLASGLVERIGDVLGETRHTVFFRNNEGEPAPTIESATTTRQLPIADHTAGFQAMLDAFAADGPSLEDHALVAVGHRVVHGGSLFFAPTVVTPVIEAKIDELSTLAPLHNPGAVAGIQAARSAFGDVPHVAVFDTAFHQTLAPAAYSYAIHAEIAQHHGIRKYGFHGTSHKYVSERAAHFVGRDNAELKQVVLHLGNGASMSAVHNGRSIDTSMGFTPLEGLVMGTRSGDIDPAVLFYLNRHAGMSIDELDRLLNKQSGIVGMTGYTDMREVLAGRDAGEPAATLAFDVYVHRLRAYLGSYLAQMGGVDVISFTAGVGENAAPIRFAALATMAWAGIEIDEERNNERRRDVRVISTDDSPVTVLVVPTNEEVEIARQTIEATANG